MTTKLQTRYLGIERNIYPKWQGWEIIKKYKEKHIKACDIKDQELDMLVENFFIIQGLKKLLDPSSK